MAEANVKNKGFFSKWATLFKRAYNSWSYNQPWVKAGAISYYALFSMPALLMLIVTMAGYFLGEQAVQGKIVSEISGYIGTESAEFIQSIIKSSLLSGGNVFKAAISLGALLFGATGVFFQLKQAMNDIWKVEESKEGYLKMIKDRLISFGMILVIGFLLLVSLVISASLNYIFDSVFSLAELTGVILEILNYVLNFFVITLLFAAIFRILPDIKIRWKITFFGATITTALFLVGEYLIGLYFTHGEPASAFGGASSVALILLWVYYACLILFFGAELTVQWAIYKGENVNLPKYSQVKQESEAPESEKAKKHYLDDES